MKITAIVMASGMSKRMKADKLHMKINNRFIYEYILDTISRHDFYEVIVVAKDDDILAAAKNLGFVGIKNTTFHIGQSESIKYGVQAAKTCDGFMFFVADQPFIKIETIRTLCNKFSENENSIILPYYNGVRGNPVIFPYNFKNQLMDLDGDNGGKVIINQNQERIIGIDITTQYESMDVDTVQDYEKLVAVQANI